MDNIFFIGARGQNVVFLKSLPQDMHKDVAIELAAWIIALADPDGTKTMAAVTKILGEG